ncbi:MAG: DUF2845 domain-containing protein [Desulfobacterales bacterium]|nr:MAG: DUF2845 domain-containing protein [Desulfobacterales bacterium]
MQMTRIGYLAVMISLFVLLIDFPAYGLRCGVKLISVGDPGSKVLAECGEPTQVQIWQEERTRRYYYNPRFGHRPNRYSHRTRRPGDHYEDTYEGPYRVKILVTVEEWLYNHGPGRFMDYVIIENGIVTDIFSGDYGY